MAALHQSVLPPSFLQLDDDQAAKPPPKRFKRFPFRRRSKRTSATLNNVDNSLLADTNIPPMTLNEYPTSQPHVYGQHAFQDQYQWAVLYENQRGLTMWSTPYYSRLSLLPNDPLPFTMPHADKLRSTQPKVSLSNYPLPDGSWRWASKAWMVDMRGATGQVQHDGFEYNLLFRKHKWHAVSKLTRGAFVRRRRWLRLMVKRARPEDERQEGTAPVMDDHVSHRPLCTEPPLSTHGRINEDPFDIHPCDVIGGEDTDEDWRRCHNLLQQAGRDGRQLELWHRWLGLKHLDFINSTSKPSMQHIQKQWSEDSQPMPSEVAAFEAKIAHVPISNAPIHHIGAILRKHTDHIMSSFVYPESRARFVELVARAGLLPYLPPLSSTDWLLRSLEFSSYLKSLETWLPSLTTRQV